MEGAQAVHPYRAAAEVVGVMWSPEARVLVRPAVIFRELVHDNQPGGLAGRFLLLAFTLGCFVSALAAPSLTPRVVIDGAISFALIPLIEIAVLAVVLSQGVRRRLPFAQTAGWFFVGNAPWLAWLVMMAFASNLVPERHIGSWMAIREASLLLPFAVSLRGDLHFFRQVSARSAAGAWFDVLLFRGLGWPAFVAFFYGTSLYDRAMSILLRLGR